MPSIAILRDVKQLYSVSDRLDLLAEQYPVVSEALVSQAQNFELLVCPQRLNK